MKWFKEAGKAVPFLVLVVMCLMMMLAGCDGVQQAVVDPESGLNKTADAINEAAMTVGAIAASPAAASIPEIWTKLALGVSALLSVGYNGYQGVRNSILKKTTRSIVRGIEHAPDDAQGAIKPLIQSEMESAKILPQGKAIVAQLKAG